MLTPKRTVSDRNFAFSAAFSVGLLLALSPSFARAEAGFMGMYLQGIDARIAAAMGRSETDGVLIRDIAVGEPAGRAGLERGDLIVSFAGETVSSFKRLIELASKTSPGQEIKIEVNRRGRNQAFTLKLGKRPGAWNVSKGEIVTLPEAGLTLASITPKIRGRFDIRWGAVGVLVTLIDPERVMKMPLSRGDVIVQVDQRAVWTPKQVEARYKMARTSGRKDVLMLIERAGEFKFMLLPIKKRPDDD